MPLISCNQVSARRQQRNATQRHRYRRKQMRSEAKLASTPDSPLHSFKSSALYSFHPLQPRASGLRLILVYSAQCRQFLFKGSAVIGIDATFSRRYRDLKRGRYLFFFFKCHQKCDKHLFSFFTARPIYSCYFRTAFHSFVLHMKEITTLIIG